MKKREISGSLSERATQKCCLCWYETQKKEGDEKNKNGWGNRKITEDDEERKKERLWRKEIKKDIF